MFLGGDFVTLFTYHQGHFQDKIVSSNFIKNCVAHETYK